MISRAARRKSASTNSLNVVSGSGSVREHVQRLGRILRPLQGKVAVLYELISAGTAEAYTSERRRRHIAFGEQVIEEVGRC